MKRLAVGVACAMVGGARAQDWFPPCDDIVMMQTTWMPQVLEECCDEVGEDCSNGFPSTCNAAWYADYCRVPSPLNSWQIILCATCSRAYIVGRL